MLQQLDIADIRSTTEQHYPALTRLVLVDGNDAATS
jgi:hypothetical protein